MASGWVLHQSHLFGNTGGWIYVAPTGVNEVWFFKEGIGWLWASKATISDAGVYIWNETPDSPIGAKGWTYWADPDPGYNAKVYNFVDEEWYDVLMANPTLGISSNVNDEATPAVTSVENASSHILKWTEAPLKAGVLLLDSNGDSFKFKGWGYHKESKKVVYCDGGNTVIDAYVYKPT